MHGHGHFNGDLLEPPSRCTWYNFRRLLVIDAPLTLLEEFEGAADIIHIIEGFN
jgi:hypothetical protein